MSRTSTIPIAFSGRTVQIKPNWAGKGIAIHKPLTLDEDGQPLFRQVQGYWRLSHINTGLSLGACMGSLDRAKTVAREWDAEFAALQRGQAMAPDRLEAWKAVVEEMRTEPPRRRRIDTIEAAS